MLPNPIRARNVFLTHVLGTLCALMDAHAVQLVDLTRRFGAFRAVDGVSFTVDTGDVLGFLGPNGAGKSTTMKMLTGFLPPSAGRALVHGRDAQRDPIGVKRSIGYLPEGAPAYPEMTPLEFLRFCARARGLRARALKRAVDAAADRAGVAHMMRQPIDTLSKGYKRRVGLAQAILHDPPVLVLDEPTDGLDPNQKAEVRRLINDMASEKAVILSTHILEEVDAICTRCVLIAQGRVLADETPARLRRRDPDDQSIILECNASESAASKALGAVEGVTSVRTEATSDGRLRVRVRGTDRATLPERVAAACKAQGWTMHSLGTVSGSLDRVFRDLTGEGG